MEGLISGAPMALLAVIAVAGIGAGAVLSAADAALQRLTRGHLNDLRNEGAPRAEAVAWILENRRGALFGVNVARLVGEMTAAVAVTLLIADLLPTWWWVLLAAIATMALVVGIVVTASPREYGRRNPARTVHALSGPIRVLGWLGRPGARLAESRQDEATRDDREQAAEDLRDMVELVSEAEHIEEQERDLLYSIFEMANTLTREVMVPRPDMITVQADTPLDKVLALFARSGFSRVPVIGENVDDIQGLVYLKDCLRASRRPHADEIVAETVMRSARLVPEMKPVDALLREMQVEQFHMAIVIDEYGGVAGLVTMEDLIEELVGEVQDEHDANILEVQDLGDGTFRIPARLPIDELGDLFGLELDDNDVDTAGGLLAKALGRVPIEGAEADIRGLHLTAERAGGRRRQIVTMLVSRSATPETEDQ